MKGKKMAGQEQPPSKRRMLSFDYLRTFLIILVLIHHSILAYTSHMWFNAKDPINNIHHIVDRPSSAALDVIMKFDNAFIIALLFLISGMFLWGSLSKKGAGKFVKGRLARLGAPLLIGMLLVIPVAIYPAQLLASRTTGVSMTFPEFWLHYVLSGFRSVGPLWFLGLLLAFTMLTVALLRLMPGLPKKLKRMIPLGRTPALYFLALVAVTTLIYTPLEVHYIYYERLSLGGLTFSIHKFVLYYVYFLVGTAIGMLGLERTLASFGRKLSNEWPIWLVFGLVFFTARLTSHMASIIFFTPTCAALAFGFLGMFLRHPKAPLPLLDNLRLNSYRVYVIYYAPVIWLQYWLYDSEASPLAKVPIVFVCSLLISWSLAELVRRIRKK